MSSKPASQKRPNPTTIPNGFEDFSRLSAADTVTSTKPQQSNPSASAGGARELLENILLWLYETGCSAIGDGGYKMSEDLPAPSQP